MNWTMRMLAVLTVVMNEANEDFSIACVNAVLEGADTTEAEERVWALEDIRIYLEKRLRRNQFTRWDGKKVHALEC